MAKIQSITPCVGDWYHLVKDPVSKEDVLGGKVAVWALLENGEVVGLISPMTTQLEDACVDRRPVLLQPPPAYGTYLPAEKLTDRQRATIPR